MQNDQGLDKLSRIPHLYIGQDVCVCVPVLDFCGPCIECTGSDGVFDMEPGNKKTGRNSYHNVIIMFVQFMKHN